MYYHHRELRHVEYGRVVPPPESAIDPLFARAYRWLGRHCGYAPQVWLSRSRSAITGFRGQIIGPEEKDEGVLFGFESIQGFPVDYGVWSIFLTDLCNAPTPDLADRAIVEHLQWLSCESDPGLRDQPVCRTWRETGDLRAVLEKHLFVKQDQVVVPALNLRAAKQVVCGDERQKRALRRMGFIEDRIVIRGRG